MARHHKRGSGGGWGTILGAGLAVLLLILRAFGVL